VSSAFILYSLPGREAIVKGVDGVECGSGGGVSIRMLRSLFKLNAFRPSVIRPLAFPARSLSAAATTFSQTGSEKEKQEEKFGSTNRYTWVVLDGVPRTCLPADIWRAIERAGVGDVVDVKLEYHNYLRTHRAWLQFSSPGSHSLALSQTLRKLSLSSLPIAHYASREPIHQIFRTGHWNPGKDVFLRGFHKTMKMEDVKQYVYVLGFGRDTTKENVRVVKANGFPCFIVRLDSVSEAYRFARLVNLPKPERDLIPNVRAQVLY